MPRKRALRAMNPSLDVFERARDPLRAASPISGISEANLLALRNAFPSWLTGYNILAAEAASVTKSKVPFPTVQTLDAILLTPTAISSLRVSIPHTG